MEIQNLLSPASVDIRAVDEDFYACISYHHGSFFIQTGKRFEDCSPLIKSAILAHEIGHGLHKEDLQAYAVACHARNNKVFNFVLNVLWDEVCDLSLSQYSQLSRLLEYLSPILETKGPYQNIVSKFFQAVRNNGEIDDELRQVYPNGVIIPKNVFGCIVEADRICKIFKNNGIEELPDYFLFYVINEKKLKQIFGEGWENEFKKIKSQFSFSDKSYKRTDEFNIFYSKTVIKYNKQISILHEYWNKRKLSLTPSFNGEINRKFLKNIYFDSFRESPTGKYFNSWKPTDVAYDVILLIDRSESTDSFKEVIMENAIILVDSLKRHKKCRTAIVDTCGDGRLVMDFDHFDKTWFTPSANDSTPLKEMINIALKLRLKQNSLLIILTDGAADLSGLNRCMFNRFERVLPLFIGSNKIPPAYKDLFPTTQAVDPSTILQVIWQMLK